MDSISQRFEYQALLGEGANAQVFRVTDKTSGRELALKVAHQSLNRHVGFRFRWLRESAIAIRLAHPSIVPICDYGQLDTGRLFMAMAIAEDGVLTEKWRKGVVLRDAVAHLQSVLRGLAYIHAHGIVHQDIKPDNILLSKHAWISDFSVARTIAEVLVNPKDVAGSPGWMAPEQEKRDAKNIGPWTDIFSWGLMLERLLQKSAMRRPFEPLISACLEPDPTKRLKAASLASRILETICASAEGLDDRVYYKPVYQLPESSLYTPLFPTRRVGRVERPALPRPQWTHATAMFMAPSIGEWPNIQDKIWTIAHSVVEENRNKAVILIGESGIGKQKLITSLSRKLADVGLMDRYRLLHNSSPYSAGHILPIREILSPHGESAPHFVERWSEHIHQMFGDAPQTSVEKASALASWCGLQTSSIVDAHLGLMFYLRTIQAQSDLPGACLLVSESKQPALPGSGLSLCDALLTESFGPRPVLLLCALDLKDSKRPKTAAKLNRLIEMGAVCIRVPALSDDDMRGHLHAGWGLSSDTAHLLAPHCRGSLRNAREIIRYFAGLGVFNDTQDGASVEQPVLASLFDDLPQRRLMETLETLPSPAQSLLVLHFLAFSELPIPMSVLMQYDAQVTEALATSGLLIQRGRWAFLESGSAKRALSAGELAPSDTQSLYRQLAALWVDNETEDPLRRDVFVGRCLCLSGDAKTGIPRLLASAQRAFFRREWALADHAASTSYDAAHSSGDRENLIESWVIGLRVCRMRESLEHMNQWLKKEPQELDLNGERWRDLHLLWLQMNSPLVSVDSQILSRLTEDALHFQEWKGRVSTHTVLAELARQKGLWRKVDEHVSQASLLASSNDPHWPHIWRLRAACWIHLGVQSDYAEKIDVFLKQTIGSIWRFMHGMCTKAELATRQCDYHDAAKLWLKVKTLASLTDSQDLHWECMCMEAATIALTGDLGTAYERFQTASRFAQTRGWSDKAQRARLYGLGVQSNSNLFREEMRKEEIPSYEFGHLWSLLLARRHMLIEDLAGVAAWWQSANRFQLQSDWSISIAPILISVLPWVNDRLPSVATEMEQELSRLLGIDRLGKIPLYELALNDT